jgi:hypothetical protein
MGLLWKRRMIIHVDCQKMRERRVIEVIVIERNVIVMGIIVKKIPLLVREEEEERRIAVIMIGIVIIQEDDQEVPKNPQKDMTAAAEVHIEEVKVGKGVEEEGQDPDRIVAAHRMREEDAGREATAVPVVVAAHRLHLSSKHRKKKKFPSLVTTELLLPQCQVLLLLSRL